jgi:hypothetical protein
VLWARTVAGDIANNTRAVIPPSEFCVMEVLDARGI